VNDSALSVDSALPAAAGLAGVRAESSARFDSRRWVTLCIVLSALFLAVLDFFIVTVSIPKIQSSLQASDAQIQWLVAVYGLTYALLLITGGRLGDIFGRRRMFMIGVAGFSLASALCGLAPDPRMLIVARALQGTMAAIMSPQVLSIIHVSFPAHEKNKAFAAYGATMGLGIIAAQLIGGGLVDANLLGLGWRPVFLVNLPIGFLALAGAAFVIPESKSRNPLRVDLVGVALISVTLLALLYPLVQGREAGWPAWSLLSMGCAAPLLAVFVAFERWKARDGSPLVDLKLFRDSNFVLGLLVTVAFYGGLSVFFMTATIFLQSGLHFSGMETAYAFLPYAFGFLIASSCSGRIKQALGSYVLNLGVASMVLGILMLLWLIHEHGAQMSWQTLMPALILYGLGQGCVAPQLINIVLANVEPEHAGSAAGVLATLQQIAVSGGVAGIGNVFFGMLNNRHGAEDYAHAFATALLCNGSVLGITFGLALALRKGRSEGSVECRMPSVE
jgi:EmrB/QacA subfamily drug resistance transporter